MNIDPNDIRLRRPIKATYSVIEEPSLAEDVCNGILNHEFNFIFAVKWWQVHKFYLIFKNDYVLSRAAEIILRYRIMQDIKKEFGCIFIEEEK